MDADQRAESVAFRWMAYALIKQLDLRDDCLPELLHELHRERALVRRYLLERAGFDGTKPLDLAGRATTL
jgi:hypothetical protein